ncbi:hypothetical protein J6590_025899 [Homalodisca vitripennis]|nr:hypothetical protein J6590_025899 [Homalodisca vitripennis]
MTPLSEQQFHYGDNVSLSETCEATVDKCLGTPWESVSVSSRQLSSIRADRLRLWVNEQTVQPQDNTVTPTHSGCARLGYV